MRNAARVLGDLAAHEANRALIFLSGGVPPLVALARHGGKGLKGIAAEVLESLSLNPAKFLIADAGGIPPLVALVERGSERLRDCAVRTLLNLSDSAATAKAIGLAGGIPALTMLRSTGSATQKRYAIAVLKRVRSVS